MLGRVQRGIEEMYRVATGVDVQDFVVNEQARDNLGPSRRPREQLLIHQGDDEVALGLFIDAQVLANLE
jgi:hypothetical protein